MKFKQIVDWLTQTLDSFTELTKKCNFTEIGKNNLKTSHRAKRLLNRKFF